jgi:tetratricopeptide (TPR) repeat protein
VLEHNRLDLLALAMLTGTAAGLLEEGPGASRSAGEALGLGRLYARGGRHADARSCFARASRLEGSALTRAEALRAYALSCRRVGAFEEAAGAWQQLLALGGCPAPLLAEANEALAVHHEHRVRDLRTARRFAGQSLQLASHPTRREAVRHRVARLDRKLGAQPPLLPVTSP